jgi:hypothetical protein
MLAATKTTIARLVLTTSTPSEGKLDYGFTGLGDQRTHNIPGPVCAYRVKVAGRLLESFLKGGAHVGHVDVTDEAEHQLPRLAGARM